MGIYKFKLIRRGIFCTIRKNSELNYNKQVPKIKSLIQQWKRRILTPIGRTTVVKTIIIPKVNHLFISLPNPRKEVISLLCRDIFEFIWKSKCDKVKRQIVSQDFLKGGLKMLDINNFIASLKCTWIKTLTNGNKPWIDIFLAVHGKDFVQKFLDFGDDFILNTLKQENNAFWEDVLKSWLCFIKTRNNVNVTKSNFHAFPIWYNSEIKINNKTIFNKKWYQNGVKTVGDFLQENGIFLTRDAFAQRFHLPHVCTMQYNSTICAISLLFKKYSIHRAAAIKRECTFFVPFYFDFILLKEKCTKDIYRCLNNIEVIPTSINKWNTVLSTYLSNNICVTYIFKVCFKTTSDSVIQWLQYRILHRILPVNYYLKKINVMTSDKCSFCKEDT